jgi:predicted Fe-Mo cluster-binding NifX family protein
MKLAISTEGTAVSTHFGRCPSFTILEIEGDRLISREEIPNPGHQPGFLPRFFHEMGVDCIVAGGMGGRASELFAQYNIKPVLGISGSIDETVDQLLNGSITGGESLCKGHGSHESGCDHDDSECGQ